MNESGMGFRSDDSLANSAGLIQHALKTAVAHQQHMAKRLFESACLDGLKNLAVNGRLPASLLAYLRKVMHLFDESLRLSIRQLRNAGLTVQCRPECPHCCHQMPTGVSIAELIYLYHGMHQSGTASRFFRRCLEAEELWVEVLHRQTNDVAEAGDGQCPVELTSKSYRDRGYRCPFLDARLCQIYPYRPFACRMHFSLTPPHWCCLTHFQNNYALEFNLEPGDSFFDALEKLDSCFQLELSDVMVCGLLELTVNVMRFKKICWY